MFSRRIVLSLVAVVAVVLSSANAAEACHRGGCFGGMFGGGFFHGHRAGCCMSDCGCGCEGETSDCGCGESVESSDDASSEEAAPVAPEKST